ncbi:MAG: lysophospholipase [Verrucomicrobiales bacterium]|jgi:lysophospholipase
MTSGNIYTSTIGTRIYQRTFETSEEPLAGALLLHGLGEHCERHEKHLELFAQHGIQCQTFDWPGHGKTEGRRGHIESMEMITTLVKEQLYMLRNTLGPNKQVGLLGHSMGGFLALYHLARYPDIADFAWINSPIIDPEANTSWLKRRLARILHSLCPRFQIQSGVRATQCRQGPAKRADPLMHHLLSVRLGSVLVDGARALQDRVSSIDPDLLLLMTHGEADVVCTARFSKALFDRLPNRAKSYQLLPGLLHEPFRDQCSEAFYQVLENWIENDLVPRFAKYSI